MERNKYLPEIKVQARMPQQWRSNIEMKKQEGESENNYIERMTRLSQRRNQAIKNVNQAQHQAAKQIFDVAKQPAYFVPVVGNAVLAGDVAGQVLNKDYTGAATTLGTVGALKYGTPYLTKGTQKAAQAAKNAFDKGIHIGNYYANIPKNSNYAYRIMRDIEAQDVLNGQPLRLGRTNPAKAASDNAAIAKARTRKGPVLYKAEAEHGGRKQFAKGMPWGGTTVTNGEPVILRIKGNGLDWKPGKHFKGNRTNFTFESVPVGSHIDLQANPETGLTTVVPSQMEGSELFYKNKLFGKNFGYKRVKVGNPNTVSSTAQPSKLTTAERLGIPKGDRNMMTKDQQDALQDLLQYANSGSKRQVFLINPSNNAIKWGNKSDVNEQWTPFIRHYAENGNSLYGDFANQEIKLDNGLVSHVRYNPYTNSAVYDVEPTKTTSLLKYSPGEASTYGDGDNSYAMRLTSPKVDVRELIDDLLKSSNPEEVAQGKQLSQDLSSTLDKKTMKSFWQGVQQTQRPGSYVSGDNGMTPLGDRLIRDYKDNRFKNAINIFRSRGHYFRRSGLSPDSYSSIIRQAQRDGSDLRWGEGFTKWNSSAVTNKHIYDAFSNYRKGNITAEQYKKIFDDWAIPLGGKPAVIRRIPKHTELVTGNDGKPVNSVVNEVVDVIIPHPYIYRRSLGGKLS